MQNIPHLDKSNKNLFSIEQLKYIPLAQSLTVSKSKTKFSRSSAPIQFSNSCASL